MTKEKISPVPWRTSKLCKGAEEPCRICHTLKAPDRASRGTRLDMACDSTSHTVLGGGAFLVFRGAQPRARLEEAPPQLKDAAHVDEDQGEAARRLRGEPSPASLRCRRPFGGSDSTRVREGA